MIQRGQIVYAGERKQEMSTTPVGSTAPTEN